MFESKDPIESWVVAAWAPCASSSPRTIFDNGLLTDSTPATEWLFDHGVIQGVPIGPPMPAGGASGSVRGDGLGRASASAAGHAGATDRPASSAGSTVNADASVDRRPGRAPSGRWAPSGSPELDSSRPLSDANAP